ncbi:MAG: PAS domain S-box protein [Bacteroidales bacterium]|nr:PAS domain S-box protein [Bacteroidales bacterium]
MKSPVKILIIDDNTDLITLIKKILTGESYQLDDANNGEEGLTKAAIILPDLILLDVMMPGMNGYEVCQCLKSNPVTRDIMVIMISAIKKGLSDQMDGFESGADGYIELPVSNRVLKNKIHTYIRIVQEEQQTGVDRELFEHIFESVSDGIVYTTLKGEIVAVNKSMEQMLGVPKSRLLGVNGITLARQLLPKTMIHNVIPLLARIISGEKISSFRVNYGDKILEITPTYNLQNQRITGVVRDITGRLKQEETIRESEERLRLTLDAISDGVWDWHIPSGKAVFSPVYYTMLGYEPYEFPEEYTSWRSLMHPDDLEKTETFIEGKIASGEGYAIEFRLKEKSGQYRWILSRGKVVERDKYGTPVRMLGTHSDISERKSGEERLLESEGKYRKIFENIQDVFYQVDATGMITEISPSIFRYSGFTRDELIGKPVVEVYKDPEDRKAMMKQLMERGEVTDYDVELKTKSGEVRWASLHIHLRLHPDGTSAGIEGSLRDVTQRKVAEEALRESEAKFRGLAEFAPYAIMIYQDDKWVYINPAAEQISGYTIGELYGMNFWDTADEEFRELVKERGQQRLHGEDVIPSYELRIVTKQGEKRWVFLNAVHIRFDGKPAGLISVIDITERMRSEQIQRILYQISDAVTGTPDVQELIRLIRKELGTLMDTSSFYIAFYDPETGLLSTPYNLDEVDNIETWPSARSLTGLVIKRNAPLLLTRTKILDMHQAGEIDLIGSLSQCWLGVPLHEEGTVTGALVVRSFTDPCAYTHRDVEVLEFISDQITISIRRKKAEEELRAALGKARESEQLKSVFLANMSHEIRTPMNGILGFTELLTEPGLTGDEQQQYIEIIRRSGNRLLDTVNDLIDISRIETGQMPVILSDVPLQMLMDHQIAFFMPQAKQKGIALTLVTKQEDYPLLIRTDKGKLNSILTNLIKNAIKYTEEGEISLTYQVKNSFLECRISDTGIGIPSHRMEAIFNRFEQADISDTRAFQGSGLGLSIARAYAEMLGGAIKVESEEGVGSVFTVRIPIIFPFPDTGETSRKPVEAEKTGTGKWKILIAEDDENGYLFLSKILQEIAASCFQAVTGEEAVTFCQNHPDTDIVLMDIKLPVLDGYEATRRIRAFNPSVVIIAQTAYALAGDREKALAAGCNDYIAKPVAKENLLKIIRTTIKK